MGGGESVCVCVCGGGVMEEQRGRKRECYIASSSRFGPEDERWKSRPLFN